MTHQCVGVVYGSGELLRIVSNYDKGLLRLSAEGLYYFHYQCSVLAVQSMERFVENQKGGVLYERAGEQDHALLSAREFQEVAAFKVGYTEYVHPNAACLSFLVGNFFIQTDGILKARCHYVECGIAAAVGAVHLGRYVSYVLFYLPDALAGAARTAEQGYVTGV